MTEFACSCPNSSEPSGAALMPSALNGPCHTRCHLAPLAMTPGMAAMTAGFSPVGCCCCAASGADSASARAAMAMWLRNLMSSPLL
jgi:hypothetical protein